MVLSHSWTVFLLQVCCSGTELIGILWRLLDSFWCSVYLCTPSCKPLLPPETQLAPKLRETFGFSLPQGLDTSQTWSWDSAGFISSHCPLLLAAGSSESHTFLFLVHVFLFQEGKWILSVILSWLRAEFCTVVFSHCVLLAQSWHCGQLQSFPCRSVQLFHI